MKGVVWFFVVVVAATAPRIIAEETSSSPELVASLFPATGLIPAGGTDHPVYRFSVSAQELDESGKVRMKGDAIVVKASEDTLVEPGQTRVISSPRGREWRLEGAVTIQQDGFVKYHVTLMRKGERVTSTAVGMRLEDR
jgi:hypothetical protein